MALTSLLAQADIFGEVSPPPGVSAYNDQAGGGIGLVLFFSRIIRLATIVGGLFIMVNLIYAGWIYLTSAGDKSAHEKVTSLITYSVLGLVIMVASYAIAGLVGVVFFDDVSFILNPTICGPEGCI